ncbi:LysR family transcriptional regulator [Brevundimonas olei]|uniref:LysR family transcriptional regulator n=1 Tax=Brevundimonas olei TaxID=657642 RepID=UPI0031D3F086
MLDALTLDQIRTFVAIADSGSFRAAAQKLSRVQSGVSVAIANLEAQLGVQLFDRSGHRPRLTPQGQILLGAARDIIVRVDMFRANARDFAAGVEIELSVAVDTLYPMESVGRAIAQMRQDFPAVAVRVQVEPLGGPLEALRRKRCLLAIMVGEDFRDPRIRFEALAPIAQIAVVASAHPLAAAEKHRTIGAEILSDHLQIVLSDPSTLSEGRDFGVLSSQTCRVNTQDAKHHLILGGVGWGRLPLWLVERDLIEGRLVRLNAAALGRRGEAASQAYLAHRLDEALGPASRRLAENLMGTTPTDNRQALTL